MRPAEVRKPAAFVETLTGSEVSSLAASETFENTPASSTPQARWSERNPKARWAQSALRSALKRGVIFRCPCETCGADEVDGHHDDYAKPMQVRWLCRKHARLNALKKLSAFKCEALDG